MIKIEHLKKEFPSSVPLRDVNAEIQDGEVVAIIGPSGTGKSTLLRCLNLLEKPTSGRIWIDGEEITAPKCDIRKIRQRMGMVFQTFNLFGHMTAIENIMMSPVDLKIMSRQEAYDRGMELLRTVGLTEKALNYPDELSGGQKQRVAIARALAMNPGIILLDEPTSALDPNMVGEVQAVIRDLSRTDKTMVIVTHAMDLVRAIATRVFFMDDGIIYEDGTPEQIFNRPQCDRTRWFIRHLKVLELTVESRDYDFLGMTTQIQTYCSRNQISPKLTNHIQLVFEEAVHCLMVPALENPRIHAAVEYSDVDLTAQWNIRYNGPRLDVTQNGEKLAHTVLAGVTRGMEYTYDESAELPNQLVLRTGVGQASERTGE